MARPSKRKQQAGKATKASNCDSKKQRVSSGQVANNDADDNQGDRKVYGQVSYNISAPGRNRHKINDSRKQPGAKNVSKSGDLRRQESKSLEQQSREGSVQLLASDCIDQPELEQALHTDHSEEVSRKLTNAVKALTNAAAQYNQVADNPRRKRKRAKYNGDHKGQDGDMDQGELVFNKLNCAAKSFQAASAQYNNISQDLKMQRQNEANRKRDGELVIAEVENDDHDEYDGFHDDTTTVDSFSGSEGSSQRNLTPENVDDNEKIRRHKAHQRQRDDRREARQMEEARQLAIMEDQKKEAIVEEVYSKLKKTMAAHKPVPIGIVEEKGVGNFTPRSSTLITSTMHISANISNSTMEQTTTGFLALGPNSTRNRSALFLAPNSSSANFTLAQMRTWISAHSICRPMLRLNLCI